MATLYGQYAANRLVDVPSTKIPATAQHGRIRTSYDKYTLTGDMSASDVIDMGVLPKGARVVGGWLKNSALSAGTLHVGYAADSAGVETADDDAFLASVAVTSAATTSFTGQNNMPGLGKAFSAEVQLQVKVATDTSATSGTIELCVHYVVD